VHIAIPLIKLAQTPGYSTIMVEPRAAFATRDRFPRADAVLREWPSEALERLCPDENTSVVVISHDEKLDNPALKVALASPAGYVGVLGTRKNIGKRLADLRELGLTDEQLSRLQAPIGVHLGAVTPEEIALSILAAIVAAKHGVLESVETAATPKHERTARDRLCSPIPAVPVPGMQRGAPTGCILFQDWCFAPYSIHNITRQLQRDFRQEIAPHMESRQEPANLVTHRFPIRETAHPWLALAHFCVWAVVLSPEQNTLPNTYDGAK